MEYDVVIGLEVHAQLLTCSKLFCGCSSRFGDPPNTNTCPVCLGLPGVLPVLNKKAVAYAIKTALALNSRINELSVFARKNYFYPDLVKGYQISQYDLPLAGGGYIEIETDDGNKRIGVERLHLEEDAGKLIHEGFPDCDSRSYVDFNRSGVPLIEIVSKPEMSSPREAYRYLRELKMILEYLEVSDCNMEEGSLRCDANISLSPRGSKKEGTKTEIKNLNSFHGVERALAYEIERQAELFSRGERVIQETRLWDADQEETRSMRTKEESPDYRYFPEPDLLPLTIGREWINDVEKTIPELPLAKRRRFIREYNLPPYDAGVLTTDKGVANYFEECARISGNPKAASNWIMGEVLRELKRDNIGISECPITPAQLSEMIRLIDKEVISGKIAKNLFIEIYKTGRDPEEIVKEKGWVQLNDPDEIRKMVVSLLEANKDDVSRYLKGKTGLFGFFIGEVMKKSRGKANPEMVNKILAEELGLRKPSS
jgi:aspartyl-tRNA(Asn)/glutamyl-tRNA(Gln) amidotransferase subunit B